MLQNASRLGCKNTEEAGYVLVSIILYQVSNVVVIHVYSSE